MDLYSDSAMSSALYKCAALKEMLNAQYITSYVPGALNAYTVHIALSLSMCINVVQTASLLYGERPLMQYTLPVAVDLRLCVNF